MAGRVAEMKQTISVLVTEKYQLRSALAECVGYLESHPRKGTKYRVVKDAKKALRDTTFTTLSDRD